MSLVGKTVRLVNSPFYSNGVNTHAAIITREWAGDTVNLIYFPDGMVTVPMVATSVYHRDHSLASLSQGYWEEVE